MRPPPWSVGCCSGCSEEPTTRYTSSMEYLTLSQLVSDVEAKQQFAFYKRFKQAVRAGALLAVPTTGSVEIARTKSPLSVPEHLLPADGKAEAWKAEALEALRKPKTVSRRLSVSTSDLESGKVSFEEAAAKYRASLQPKTAKRGRRKKEEQ